MYLDAAVAVFLFVVLAVTIVIAWAIMRHRETFAEPAPKFRPCTVYFTKHTEACDSYPQLLQLDKKRISAYGSNVSGNDKVLVASLLADESYKPLTTVECKVSFPNWVEPVTHPPKILSETERGNPESWAFCLAKGPTEADVQNVYAQVGSTNQTLSHDGESFDFGDGVKYARLAFKSLEPANIRDAYCRLGAGAGGSGGLEFGTPMLLGLQVDSNLMTIKAVGAYRRNNAGNLESAGDVGPIISRLIAKTARGSQVVVDPIEVPTAVVYKITQNLCKKPVVVNRTPMSFNIKNLGITSKIYGASEKIEAAVANALIGKSVGGIFNSSYLSDNDMIYIDIGAEDTSIRDATALITEVTHVAGDGRLAVPSINFGATPIEYSLSLWIKVDYLMPYWRRIMLHGNHDGDRTPGLWVYPSGRSMHFRVRTTGDWNDGNDVYDAQVPPLGTWYNYTAVITGGRTVKVYINGNLAATRTLYWPITWNNTAPKYLFTGPAPGVYVQRAFWYNRALVPEEVEYLAKAPIALNTDVKNVTKNTPTDLRELFVRAGSTNQQPVLVVDGIGYNVQIDRIDGEPWLRVMNYNNGAGSRIMRKYDGFPMGAANGHVAPSMLGKLEFNRVRFRTPGRPDVITTSVDYFKTGAGGVTDVEKGNRDRGENALADMPVMGFASPNSRQAWISV